MSVFYVGITDTNWFSLLRQDYNDGLLDKQVNFWTPGTKEFKAIEPEDLFLFKLHNKKSTGENGEIVGGGYFSYYDRMTIPDAWDKFGRENGRDSLDSMMKSLKGMQEKNNMQSSIEIGCIILENVFFLDKWIDEIETEANALPLKGEERMAFVKTRVNQSVFRERLLKKYHICCLCKVENQALLTASHIKPWAASSADEKLDAENGFLLCPNHNALFDGGFISFDDDGKIMISSRLSQVDCTFTNVIPAMKINLSEKNKEYLEYHRKKIFA